MVKSQKLYSYLFLSLLAACSSKLSPTQEVKYSEDLSAYRPQNEAKAQDGDEEPNADSIPIFNVKEPDSVYYTPNIKMRLDSLVDSISINNRALGYIQGFTIQVYTGNNRERANDAKARVYQLLPNSYPKLRYQQPIFKVKVGQFYTRLEAQETFSILRKEIPTAIIVPERIYPKR